MTPENLAALFHEQVVPTYRDFVTQLDSDSSGNSQDLRSGLLAALAVYHFREHLEGALALTITAVSARCPDYSLLRDVADVAKHRSLDRSSAVLKSAEAVHEVVVITVYEDAFGEYRDSKKVVELSLPDGTLRRLDEVLTNVMIFWDGYLRTHKIPLLQTKFWHRKRNQPLDRDECAEAGRNIKLVRGLRFNHSFRVQRYNYDKKIIEPVDVSGSEVRFRIYKPKYEIDLVLTNDKTGQELRRTVALSPEQVEEFDKLASDDARQAFLQDALQIREAFGNLAAEARETSSSGKVDDHET